MDRLTLAKLMRDAQPGDWSPIKFEALPQRRQNYWLAIADAVIESYKFELPKYQKADI